MGMFNVIKVKVDCPKCGGKIDEWQTKNLVIDDIYPVDNVLEHYDLNKGMDAEIHSYCDNCNKELSLIIKKGKICKE
ncbi:MAG: hypothetical protein AAB550_04010 [Patescibacteria group bacterium]